MMDAYEKVEKQYNTEERERLEVKVAAARIDAQKWHCNRVATRPHPPLPEGRGQRPKSAPQGRGGAPCR